MISSSASSFSDSSSASASITYNSGAGISTTSVDRNKWVNICTISMLLSFLLFLIIEAFSVVTECRVCPRGSNYMSEPFRKVPGGSGMTCGELMTSNPICQVHAPLMKKFDLASYCGCSKSGPPSNRCTFDCPFLSEEETVGLSPKSSVGGTLARPSLKPSRTVDREVNPGHTDEIVLSDVAFLPSRAPSFDEGNEKPPKALQNNFLSDRIFDADKMLCSDLSTTLPFVTDQLFCGEVQAHCCSITTSTAQMTQNRIPAECILCGHGFEVLEEKFLPGKRNGETCGQITRFYEHAANAMFCENAVPLLREHCCTEVDLITTQLEANQLSSAAIQYMGLVLLFIVVATMMTIVG
ncbi:hypothetical protein IV203_007137 [Nitzschia inconspicua]|uniref:Uncharacterized protein n=1 Tax=Nitzschia inconspicua TaxID=303405 RepID=A0A9K3KFA9_9STRA|nr:hypothetical protein IV203_007137 [Nitzschia inconspicua]